MEVLIAVGDLMARARLDAAAKKAGHTVAAGRRVPEPGEAAPDLMIVDLDSPGALEDLEAWMGSAPTGRVVGFAFHVNTGAIDRARGLGVEVVHHGATRDPAALFA